MLAADVLVTDYLSLMCDFAVHRAEPMVFPIDDWDTYRKTERGEPATTSRHRPRPVLRDHHGAELAEAIRDSVEPRALRAAFRRTWCAEERGITPPPGSWTLFEGLAPSSPYP